MRTLRRDQSPKPALPRRAYESTINLWRALRLVWASSRSWTIASLALSLLQGVIPVAILYLTGTMIDAVANAIAHPESGMVINDIIGYIILVGIVTFVNVASGTFAGVVREGQALTVSDYVTSAIHAKSILIDLEYYENAQHNDRLHRAQQDAPYRPRQIVDDLISSLSDIFLLIGVTGLLLTLNSVTPLILFASAFPIVLVRLHFSRQMYAWMQRSAETERRTMYYGFALTRDTYAKEVRLYNTGQVFAQRYSALRDRLRFERLNLVRRRAVSELLVQLLGVVALFGAFTLVAQDALRATITIGEVVIAFQAFQRGQSTFQALLGSFASLYESNLFLKDFYDFLALEPLIQSPQEPTPIPQPMVEGFRFEEVGFHYARSSNEVLKSINLTIKPGEVVALVGENGAGKTTLIKLLCRLYDPSSGRITLDGVDLREYDLLQLRRMITVLFQDFNIYQLSALENIWVGDVSQPPDLNAITEAAEASGAAEFIQKLPQTYDTQLGNWFSDGRELSYGQWQKIALARAFLRNSQMIILDEPTSALDVIAEHDVFERFRSIIAGRSAIIISHRLSTIRMADRIYVLDDGCIAEYGTHDELIALNGIYAKMYNIQSKYYR